jgi:outer membrane biogenesis lipoprotein LolB
MKKLGFVVLGSAALALSACGSKNADQLNEAEAQNVEANVLNDLADNAANAEVEALGAQQQQLDAESNEAPATVETPSSNATDPKQVEDDVQGM